MTLGSCLAKVIARDRRFGDDCPKRLDAVQTNLKSIYEFLHMDQRFLIPLFQRGYAWTRENQWDLLWEDVSNLADQVLAGAMVPHFMGAVVLQNSLSGVPGELPTWEVVDGQQRLTTIQIMADAAAAALAINGGARAARKLQKLVENDKDYWSNEDDRYKLWPTNKDRDAYREVMAAEPPIRYDDLKHSSHRTQLAHRYFFNQVCDYAKARSNESAETRGEALTIAISTGLQVVAISLDANENAQEIFETLNARMTPLQPTDLIKNFLFQRLAKEGEDVDRYYRKYWQPLESQFWEAELAQGRIVRPRLTVFVSYWLEMMSIEEIPASDVFRHFKRYCEQQWTGSTVELLQRLGESAEYFAQINRAIASKGTISGVELSAYRFVAMDFSIAWPIILWLKAAERDGGSAEIALKAINWLESWMVRRLLTGDRAQSYARSMLLLLRQLAARRPEDAADVVREFLESQTAQTSYWPNDAGVVRAVTSTAIYKTLTRARLRVILEALEDDARGIDSGLARSSQTRIGRGTFQIEHVLPQDWEDQWPIGDETAEEREFTLHMLGNLTILPSRFNASISNSSWIEKRAALNRHSIELLNAGLVASDEWSESKIRDRTAQLAERLIAIWPAPRYLPDKADVRSERPNGDRASTIVLANLLEAQLIAPGDELTWIRRGKGVSHHVTVTDDGHLETSDHQRFSSPSDAAYKLSGSSYNGWTAWTVADGRSLDEVRADLLNLMAPPNSEDFPAAVVG